MSRALRRHLIVAMASAVAVVIVLVATGLSTETWGRADQLKRDDLLWRFNVATGTVALALLVVTLSIGPARTFMGRGTPAHLPWRRVTGVWSAVLVLAHVPGGIAIHTTGWRFWTPFASALPGVEARALDEFTLGYWVGLLALASLIPLVITSRDSSLRRLGAKRWKRLHRLTYLTYGLVAVHVVALQYGESRDLRHVALSASMFAVAIGLRFAAILRASTGSIRAARRAG